jgi:TonB family protein
LYGALKGDRVYTIYINTRIGTAIMQFADPNSVGHGYVTTLTAPQVLRANVADQATVSGRLPKVLVSCNLDERGEVNNARILQSENNDFAAKVLAALPLWKFTPAYRGNQPIAVSAIVGFGVDTN